MTASPAFHFGTKSETLERLSPHLGKGIILPLMYFPVSRWIEEPAAILAETQHFACNKLIVRSSAQNEDSVSSSMAGAFVSRLNIPAADTEAITRAIEEVCESFVHHARSDNQILIQPMLENIQMSGVVMTHDLQHGAPYYVVNYDDESGQTDTITGGTGIQKTVLIYRGAALSTLQSSRLRILLQACRELESLCGSVPLDIEFAVDHDEQVYILQVRRITLSNTWHPVTERRVARMLDHVHIFLKDYLGPVDGLYGKRTLLGVMPDWNPAEIIGTTPRPLASSLYRYLITDTAWSKARARMGYHHPEKWPLMILLANHPYIDVRLSFNSFLPGGLPSSICHKLVNAWLDRLEHNPQWHDKVEFEIVPTCLDFTFSQTFNERYPGLLSPEELALYQQALSTLTCQALIGESEGSLEDGLTLINACTAAQNNQPANLKANLTTAKKYLDRCVEQGTLAFSMLARHAFIAEALLRSASNRSALSKNRIEAWKRSIQTVTTALTQNYAQVCTGEMPLEAFLQQFGHLRPGTYDITSLRYDERNDLFASTTTPQAETPNETRFELSTKERQNLQALIDEQGWPLSSDQLLTYAGKAIQAREYAKLIFTKDLSDALSVLTAWGGRVGLSRDDLSFLDIQTLLNTLTAPLMDETDRVFLAQVTETRHRHQQDMTLKLGHLMSSPEDLLVVPMHRSMPNFITEHFCEAETLLLQQDTPATLNLDGKIICIENADPGYDWIFTRNIVGLVTLYGGANSHMAIRCAEFGIPAAIGCGAQLFSCLEQGKRMQLNCRDKTLHLT